MIRSIALGIVGGMIGGLIGAYGAKLVFDLFQ